MERLTLIGRVLVHPRVEITYHDGRRPYTVHVYSGRFSFVSSVATREQAEGMRIAIYRTPRMAHDIP